MPRSKRGGAAEFTLSVEKDADGNWGFADGAENEIYEMLLG